MMHVKNLLVNNRLLQEEINTYAYYTDQSSYYTHCNLTAVRGRPVGENNRNESSIVILYIMQLTTGLLLYFPLLTLVLPLIPLTTLFFSIVLLLILASWVLPTIGSSLISLTGHFQSPLTQVPPHHIVILWCSTRLCLGSILFTIYVSPIASIVFSHGVSQQQYADDTQLFLFISPAYLFSSLCSLHSWFLHNGLVLNPTKTEAICFGTNPRLKSLSSLTSIEVAGSSVSLANYIKLLGVTLDNNLNFDRHISNVCFSSYFRIHALRHIRSYLNSGTSKTIARAIVGSKLDYANSVLTGISARNIHRLQRVQIPFVTRSTTNSTSAVNSLYWLPIRQRIDHKLATNVHRSLHNACPQYLSSMLHTYTPTRQLRSASLNLLSQPRVKIVLAFRGFRHVGLAPLLGTPSLLILDLSTPTPPSNPISELTCSVLKAFLAPNNSIHALLIHINMLIYLAPKLFYITFT